MEDLLIELSKEDQLTFQIYQIQLAYLCEMANDLENRISQLEDQRKELKDRYTDILSRSAALDEFKQRAKQDILSNLAIDNHEDYSIDITDKEIRLIKNS